MFCASLRSAQNIAYLVWITMIWRFDRDLAENYVTFGGEHQKLVGNPACVYFRLYLFLQSTVDDVYCLLKIYMAKIVLKGD